MTQIVDRVLGTVFDRSKHTLMDNAVGTAVGIIVVLANLENFEW